MQNGGQLLLLLVLIVFTVWVFSRGRRQQREMQLTQSRIQPGAEVMMTSGLYGRVLEVSDAGQVRLETSPGVVSRWDRRAVARIISAPAAESALEDEPVEPGALEPGDVRPTPGPTEAQPLDAVEDEPMRRSEPVLPVEPTAPDATRPVNASGTPAAPEPGRPGSPDPDRPPASEPPGPVASPRDGAPPDRG